jgi:acetylornithine deacetylase/succinyl-diaminopimelate desuccinylase-like protein
VNHELTPQLEDLFAFLRFPSISPDSSHHGEVRACAEWLIAKLTGSGMATELHDTPKHPIVVARNPHVAGRRTVSFTATTTCNRSIR